MMRRASIEPRTGQLAADQGTGSVDSHAPYGRGRRRIAAATKESAGADADDSEPDAEDMRR